VRIHADRGTPRLGLLVPGSSRPACDDQGDTAIVIDEHDFALSPSRYCCRLDLGLRRQRMRLAFG
jgi:hypothetical protein